MASARRFRIKGRVQGVFFRDSTRRVASTLGILGHAINLPNGDVEVFACGDEPSLDELASWLQHGPPMANVTSVVAEAADWQDLQGFHIG
ncbi:MAG: acylphosphatase [Gammaproteobacteria bacterium]|nr:acylphosphatase [Gammaproteobacteria bacterium]